MPTKKTAKKKSRKMDPKLLANDEMAFLKKRYKVPAKVARKVHKDVGRSRTKVYDVLRGLGYNMPEKRTAK